jgi:hypothetical protein
VDDGHTGMVGYTQIAERRNLGKDFLDKGLLTKSELKHEERLELLTCCLRQCCNYLLMFLNCERIL